MTIHTVLAGIAVTDMDRAQRWYATFFGHGPDAEPMPGLAEWRTPRGTVQLVADADRAGGSILTVHVPDAHQFSDDLAARGGPSAPVDDNTSTKVLFTTVTDPDGNSVSIVQVRDGIDL